MVTCDKFVVGAAVCRAHPADVRESFAMLWSRELTSVTIWHPDHCKM